MKDHTWYPSVFIHAGLVLTGRSSRYFEAASTGRNGIIMIKKRGLTLLPESVKLSCALGELTPPM